MSPDLPAVPSDPTWPRGLPLRLEGVRLRRGEAEILRGIDLTFEPGRPYVLLGPSGAGKATPLRGRAANDRGHSPPPARRMAGRDGPCRGVGAGRRAGPGGRGARSGRCAALGGAGG